MLKLILTVGLPGSGKSTWAKQVVAENPGRYKIVCRDDLRDMLDDGAFSKKNEEFVTKVQHSIILEALKDGKHVIVADTNLNPKTVESLRSLVKGLARVECQDFTDVPLEECIARDLKRLKSVGKDVIMRMYNSYLAPKKAEPPMKDPAKKDCIIVDIDGTLAKMNGRKPYDWERVGEDELNINIAKVVDELGCRFKVVVVSGRDGCCKGLTEEWLVNNGVLYDELHMRAPGDNRKDSIIKEEIYREHIEPKYNVVCVLDDRDSVISMWRNKLGLTALQVDYGDF